MENRFQAYGREGQVTGFNFDGTNIVPCIELDAMFDCTMIGERAKDAVFYTFGFVRNQIMRSNNPLTNLFNGALTIG